jgi:hypothetical protein
MECLRWKVANYFEEHVMSGEHSDDEMWEFLVDLVHFTATEPADDDPTFIIADDPPDELDVGYSGLSRSGFFATQSLTTFRTPVRRTPTVAATTSATRRWRRRRMMRRANPIVWFAAG